MIRISFVDQKIRLQIDPWMFECCFPFNASRRLNESRQLVRTVGGSGAAQVERGRRQAGAHAAAGLTRQVLRPVEFAAAAAAAAWTRWRAVAGRRWWCGGDGGGGSGGGDRGGGDTAAMRQVIVLRCSVRRRQ